MLLVTVLAKAQIGVGTTTPYNALDVESNSTTKTAVDINNTSSGDALLQLQLNGTTKFSMGIDNSDGDKFKISTDSTFNVIPPALSIDALQNVGIGTSSPNSSAILELNSVNKGFLPPRMTTSQRNAISNPPTGLVVFNSTTGFLEVNSGIPATPVWQTISPGATGSTGATGATGSAGPTGATGASGADAIVTRSSTTSNAIGTGTKTFAYTSATNLGWVVGSRLRASNSSTNWIEGVVTAVSATSVTINADLIGGTGTFTSWNIALAGERGATGAIGPAGPTGATGATGATGLLSAGASAGNTPYWNGTSWVVNSSNIFNNGGNVGIGSTNPQQKFHLDGANGNTAGPHFRVTTSADAFPVFQQLNWTHDNISMMFDAYFDGAWRSSHATSNFKIYKTGNQFNFNYASATPVGNAITFQTGISLQNNGNVGIGTTAPTTKFHVNGTAGSFRLVDGTQAAGRILTSDANGVATWQAAASGLPTGTNGQTLRHNGTSWVANSTIFNNGTNVGIGTAVPNAALQFGNLATNRRIVLWETANNDHQYYGFGINGGMLRYQVDALTTDHGFYAGNGAGASVELMRIKGNGNIGIGTVTPTEKLDIESNDANKTAIDINNTGAGDPKINFQVGGSSTFSIGVDNSDVDKFKIGTTALETNTRLTIDASGNVGIGTTNPNPMAILDLQSTSKGFLPPRLTTSERGVILLQPVNNGLIIFNTTVNRYQYLKGGTTWVDFLSNESLSKTITIEKPTAGDDITIFRTNVPITVSQVNAVSTGTSPSTTFVLRHSTDRNAAGSLLTTSAVSNSITTGNNMPLSVTAIPAGSWIWMETSAATGSNVVLAIDILYTVN